MRDMYEIFDKFENWQDQIINLRITSPWLLKKASVWLCHQHNLFSFDRTFLKLADKVDMNGIFNKFETWPDWIICFRVTSLWLWEKPIFDFISSITHSVLIGSSWNLQIKWTWMKSWTGSKTVQVKLSIIELHLLDRWKCLFSTLSSAFDQIFLNLTYKMWLKLLGQLDHEVIQCILV